MIHSSVRIYANGDQTRQGVHSEDLAYHIWYNQVMRFGCTLYIDGFRLSDGYSKGEFDDLIKEQAYKATTATPPYK